MNYEKYIKDLEINLPRENQAKGDSIILVKASEVTPKPINWIMKDWLAKNEYHTFAGAGGTGKTTLALNIASIITSGGIFPNGDRCPVIGNVLIWSGEDTIDRTLVPRLMANGADLNRCFFITGCSEKGQKRPFDPALDFPKLNDEIKKIGEVVLLIVDPIVTSIKGKMNDANDVRKGLQPFLDFTDQHDCAVIGITHFGKGTQGRDPSERTLGSQAFTAVARVVWATASMESGDRVLVHPKNNIGSDKGGFKYTVDMVILSGGIEASKITWGDAIDGQAREILNQFENIQGSNESANSALQEAKGFLSQILQYENLSSIEVYKQANEAGISKSTLMRAKTSLFIRAVKNGMTGGWSWSLFPEGDQNMAKILTQNNEHLHDRLNTFDEDNIPF